jgi:hypothetical protein
MAEKNSSLPPLQCRVVGRVDSVDRYNNVFTTKVLCPAADLYSKPAVVPIRSTVRIGTKGDDIDVLVRLGGYPKKPYQATDKNTGEIRTVSQAEATLDLVE